MPALIPLYQIPLFLNIMHTIFQKIINREIPASIVFENERIIAFHDIQPQAPIHILIVPKALIPTLNDLQQEHHELVGEMVVAAATIAKNLAVASDGYRLVINCNNHGGQTVYHLHMHFLAGRPMLWPPG